MHISNNNNNNNTLLLISRKLVGSGKAGFKRIKSPDRRTKDNDTLGYRKIGQFVDCKRISELTQQEFYPSN